MTPTWSCRADRSIRRPRGPPESWRRQAAGQASKTACGAPAREHGARRGRPEEPAIQAPPKTSASHRPGLGATRAVCYRCRWRAWPGQGAGTGSKLGRVPEITEERFPWPPASATGVGSLPGTDPVQAQRLVFGELPDLPHLAELPARGPGADLTGRTAALLVDLPVELTTTGWRFSARPGRDLRQ